MQHLRSSTGLFRALVGLLSACLSDASSFLFFSSPSTGSVHFARVLTAAEHSQSAKMVSKKLLGLEKIQEPRGLAIDSLRKILYVVDGNGGNGGILYAARIYQSKGDNVACEAPVKIADNLAGHWVAVDFRGLAFFVAGNQIWSVNDAAVANKLDGTPISDGEQTSTIVTGNSEANHFLPAGYKIVYSGDSIESVNLPRGLAADGYRLFWSNGKGGTKGGTVVSGLEEPKAGMAVNKIATNLGAGFGLCLSSQRVFYTDAEAHVFSARVHGGPVTTVASNLQTPRGCVFDGDGTVFVADSAANEILSFAGAAAELGPRRLSLALAVEDPFGLAMFKGNRDHLDSGASRSTFTVVAIVSALLGLTY